MQNYFSRSLLAVTTAGLLAGGSAQALEVAGKALDVYGQVNIYAGSYKDGTAPNTVVQHTTLGDNDSRLGVQGERALGSNGLTGIYQIESSVWNTDASGAAGIGNRELMVGIKAGEHTVQAVRGLTVYEDIQGTLDPFQGAEYGLGVDASFSKRTAKADDMHDMSNVGGAGNTARVAALRYGFGNANDGINFGVQWGKNGSNTTPTAPTKGSDTSQANQYLAAKLKFTDKSSGAWGAFAYNAENLYNTTATKPAIDGVVYGPDVKLTNMLLAAGWSNVGEAGTGITAAAGLQMNSLKSTLTAASGNTGDYDDAIKTRQIFLSGQYDEKDWAVRAGVAMSSDGGSPDATANKSGLKQPKVLRMALGADYKFDKNTLAYLEYVNLKTTPENNASSGFTPDDTTSTTLNAVTLGMQYKF